MTVLGICVTCLMIEDVQIATWFGVACKVALEVSFLAQHGTGILDLHRE